MALKIWLNNSMQKIDTSLHKPVIFLNGDKYRIDKAYTFVNGARQQIWGETGIQIDYISSSGSLGGGMLFAIGESWASVYANRNIYRIDISNMSNPTLIQSIAWGNIVKYNGLLSTGNNSIFLGSLPNSCNKLNVAQDGTITVVDSYNVGGNAIIDMCDNYALSVTAKIQTVTTQSTRNYVYGTDYYFNTTRKHTTGSWTTGNTSFLIYSGYESTGSSAITKGNVTLQVDVDAFLINMWGYNNADTGVYYMTDNNLSHIYGSNIDGLEMLDGNIICRKKKFLPSGMISGTGWNSFAILDKSTLAELYQFPADPSTDKKVLKFLGKIDNYYYLIGYPYSGSGDVKLYLLDDSDLSVALEKTLPDDPFEEYSGQRTFWYNCNCVPSISKSGFLGIGTYSANGLKLRIARFSEII